MTRFPLTLFEEYLFHDDKRAYPCWVVIRFTLRGTLDRAQLRDAWRRTVRRHPTLHAVVRRGAFGRCYWEPLPDSAEPILLWRDSLEAAPDTERWTSLDPTREPAVRLVVTAHADRVELSLEAHHSVFDGAAAFAVFHEVMIHYARARGVAVDVPELRPERFRDRNRFGLGWWAKLKLLPVQLLGMFFVWQLERRRAVPLAPHAPVAFDDPPPPGHPAIVSRRLTPDELTRLRAIAKQLDVSLNDLCIRDFQAAIGQWRERRHIGTREDWIFLAVPIGLRRPADRFLPAANIIGMVVIDRQAKSLANRPRLLRRAHEDMELVKRHQLGFTFLFFLWWVRRWPGGIQRRAQSPRGRATAIFTNLGQLYTHSPLRDASRRLAVPGAVLDDVAMAPPFRQHCGASLALAIYAGKLIVDLHHDPRMLDAAAADELIDSFVTQLGLSVAEAAGVLQA